MPNQPISTHDDPRGLNRFNGKGFDKGKGKGNGKGFEKGNGKGKGKGKERPRLTPEITRETLDRSNMLIDRLADRYAVKFVADQIDDALDNFSHKRFYRFSLREGHTLISHQESLASEPWCSQKMDLSRILNMGTITENERIGLNRAFRCSRLFSELHEKGTMMFYEWLLDHGFKGVKPTSYSVGITVFIGNEDWIQFKFSLHRLFFECPEYVAWMGEDLLPEYTTEHPLDDTNQGASYGDLWDNNTLRGSMYAEFTDAIQIQN
jgi:hypothetical protein